jgi:hypothetical protein
MKTFKAKKFTSALCISAAIITALFTTNSSAEIVVAS